MLTYAEVRPWARAIRNAVRTRSMPPWKPVPGYGGPFVGEQRLSDAEIELIAAWVDAGAPNGEGADFTLAPASRGGWRLGEPDLVIEMPEPYTLQAEGTDVLRKFAIPIPIPDRRYVQGVEFQPGNPRVVHHANMKIDPTLASRQLDAEDPEPGYDGVTPFSARFPFGYFLGWTPGQVRPLAAEGMAWILDPDSDLLLELHLTPSGEPETVQSRIGFFFTAAPPTTVPFTIRLGKQDLDIPPGARDYRSEDRYVLPVDVEVHGIQPHAHYLARRVRGYATLPDGTQRPLIAIDDWDFHWQDSYRYAEPFVLPRGTELTMEFTYDNSAANPANPHAPPRRITWGQLSANEMGDLWIQVVPRRASDLDLLVRDRRPMELAEDIIGFEMVLAADPDQRMVHDDVALLYTQFGRIPDAAKHYRESVRLAPGSAAAAYNLGTALLQLGDLDAAIAELERALRIDPAYALAHNNLGAALKLRGDLVRATSHYRQAVRLRPGDGEALYNLANALLMQGALDEAATQYERAIAGRPGSAEPLAELALLLATHPDAARRDPGRAVRLAERAAELTGHEQPGVLEILAAAYAATGAIGRAVATADAALRLVPPGREDVAAAIRERLDGYRRMRATRPR
ncbi:MAG: tetratricopeptide repeat protein [Acidobacteria bacterium]|nr:tetratricopeptide repeat protein [Acidobacteriota bacterium]